MEKKNNSQYYEFDEFPHIADNPHYFLAEDLLVPRANNSDTQRINMFSTHLNQFVHLEQPEFPKVFTNFETQAGEYSVAYKKAEKDFKIISKIVKNAYNYHLIVQYSDGVYDILHFNNSQNITEDYGYKMNDCIPDAKPGDRISKGTFLSKSDNYDDDGNFMYGVNLKSVYIPWRGGTYEDGIVISESAAEKLKSFKVEKTLFTVNNNDVLLNLYGNKNFYKSFPKVGDTIDNKVLVALRRKSAASQLFDFQESRLDDIDFTNDEVIYTSGGKVVDIEIYSNIPLWKLRGWKKNEKNNTFVLDRETGLPYVSPDREPNVFIKEVISVLEDQERYYNELCSALEEIIPVKVQSKKELDKEKSDFGVNIKHAVNHNENEKKYTDELAFYWKRAHEFINNDIPWRFNGKVFDFFKIKFTILKDNPATPGIKLSGRYGNKGVVAYIEKDENMPTNEFGEKAEIILNPLGVMNRLNLSQIQEQYINFMSNNLIRKLKELKEEGDTRSMEEEFFSYLRSLNKEQYDFLYIEYLTMNRAQKEEFFEDVIRDGIYIHQSPFFGNTTMEEFVKLYEDKSYLSKPYTFTTNDGGVIKHIEKPIVMGEQYFIRLKHESFNKMSARSTSLVNTKNVPSKSTLKKEKKLLYSKTPIRLGEMETTNLMIAKRPDLVSSLLKSHSTLEGDRVNLITGLLTSDNPFKYHTELTGEASITRQNLNKLLDVLDLELSDE